MKTLHEKENTTKAKGGSRPTSPLKREEKRKNSKPKQNARSTNTQPSLREKGSRVKEHQNGMFREHKKRKKSAS